MAGCAWPLGLVEGKGRSGDLGTEMPASEPQFLILRMGVKGGFGQGWAVVNCAEHLSFLCTDFSFYLYMLSTSFFNSVLTIQTSPPIGGLP